MATVTTRATTASGMSPRGRRLAEAVDMVVGSADLISVMVGPPLPAVRARGRGAVMHPDIRETTPRLRERTARAAGASRTALGSLARAMVMSVAVGAFLAAVGAFGSGEAPALAR